MSAGSISTGKTDVDDQRITEKPMSIRNSILC